MKLKETHGALPDNPETLRGASYYYTVLRAYPMPTTEEFINVGIMVFFPHHKIKLGMILTQDALRYRLLTFRGRGYQSIDTELDEYRYALSDTSKSPFMKALSEHRGRCDSNGFPTLEGLMWLHETGLSDSVMRYRSIVLRKPEQAIVPNYEGALMPSIGYLFDSFVYFEPNLDRAEGFLALY